MTIKKAVKMLDGFIEYKSKCRDAYGELRRKWETNPLGLYVIAKQLENLNGSELELLVYMKKQIVTTCKHPKKFRDIDPEGKLYCVGCNQNL